MNITQAEFQKTVHALLEAYPSKGDLMVTLTFMGKEYADLTREANRRVEYVNIVQKARAQGWAKELIKTTFSEHPEASQLAALAAEMNLTEQSESVQLISDLHPEAGDVVDAETASALQRLVTVGEPPANAVQLLGRLARLGAQTGTIEIAGSHQGTCFLIGPDLVLTNHHVISPILQGVSLDDVAVRFDRFVDEDQIVLQGLLTSFRPDWHVISSPHDPVDELEDLTALPAAEHLDFAIVRLTDQIGNTPPPGATENRGWCKLQDQAREPNLGSHITLTQHPSGSPRQLTFGRILSYDGERRRVRYSANTKNGSSGSPVTNNRGELVALHHAGDPNFARLATYNQGIPIGRVCDYLKQADLDDILDS